MPSTLNEHTQFTDSSGKPLVNGKVYFGVQNADPTVSPITIFSDRALTVPIANPQILDSLGRTTNKVWVSGRYSIRVDDLNDNQIYQNLDNGETADKGITALENVSGGNTITATAASAITAYEDLEQYTFRTAQVNTDVVTLNIDTVGAKSVVKNHDQPILPGEFEADQNIIVSYNATDDVFEWTNQNVKTVTFYEGTAVVSAATANIWADDGNTVHLTGNTGPVTSFGTAPQPGSVRWVICDSTPTFTHSANLNLPGAADYTAAAGDVLRVYADTITQFDVIIFKADGAPVVADPGLKELSTATFSGASTAAATWTPANTDTTIIVKFSNVTFSTDAVALTGRTSTDGGSTWDSTANDYGVRNEVESYQLGVWDGNSDSAATNFPLVLAGVGADLSNAATASAEFDFHVLASGETSHNTNIRAFNTWVPASDDRVNNAVSIINRRTNADVNGLQLTASAGTMAGRVTVYEVTRS